MFVVWIRERCPIIVGDRQCKRFADHAEGTENPGCWQHREELARG